MKINELKNDVKERAIADYVNTNLKVVEIAKRHKISVSRLSAWVREVGAPRRPRGLRQLTEPSARANKILIYAAAHGFSNAARHFNITKQLVSSLAKRWGLKPPKRGVGLTTAGTGMISPIRSRKQTRELVICFRLRAGELSVLRASLPESVTQSTRSPHKLARAAILDRLAVARAFETPVPIGSVSLPITCTNETEPKLSSDGAHQPIVGG